MTTEDSSVHEQSAFGLEEYLVPKCGIDADPLGGTMPKADRDKGGLFHNVQRLAEAAPGPEKYAQDVMTKSFVGHIKNGKFSGVGRDEKKKKGPTPGMIDVSTALRNNEKKTRGGPISKTDRKNIFVEEANRNNVPDPCKYSPNRVDDKKILSPRFASPKNVSRVPNKPNGMGPGYYNPDPTTTEKKVLVYSGCKEDAKSFLDKIMNSKDKGPAPGHLGIPQPKNEDRAGKQKHTSNLMNDRHLSPRSIDSAR